jgi:hypothetical protein
MNLLDHNSIREHLPRCGAIVPGTHQFKTVMPFWSPPQVQILEGVSSVLVAQEVSKLLANEDIHVCAVSPAAISMAGTGTETYSWIAITVIYQDRIKPAAAADAPGETADRLPSRASENEAYCPACASHPCDCARRSA